MNGLADKVHKQKCQACSDYALHNMPATLFNNHPYINSSGTPVGSKFTATYHRSQKIGDHFNLANCQFIK